MTLSAIPTKPWAKSPRDRIRDVAFAILAVAFSYAIVGVTAIKGKQAYAANVVIAYSFIT